MARNKEFDRDDVLRIARDVFWAQGYNATSTDDLRLAMGIGRQSFYDTFKGKRQIYLEVIENYNASQMTRYTELFRKSPSALHGLRELLTSVATQSAGERKLGCLGIASVCEFGTTDPDLAAIHTASASRFQKILEKAVREAQDSGEIHDHLKTKCVAQFLSVTLAGMKVAAKAGADRAILQTTASLAINGLMAH